MAGKGLGVNSIMSGSGNDSISVQVQATTPLKIPVRHSAKATMLSAMKEIPTPPARATIQGHGSLNPGSFVTGEYQTFEYATGSGKDVVYGYNSNDTIKIVGQYTTSTVGSDVLIKVGNGSIRLKDAKDATLNIVSTKKVNLVKSTDDVQRINVIPSRGAL